jgi:hypothetical protein
MAAASAASSMGKGEMRSQQRHRVPEKRDSPNIRQTPAKKIAILLPDIAAWGRRKVSKKSVAIPVDHKVTIRPSEARSRAFEGSSERLTLQAMASGTIHKANGPQKIRAKIGPERNRKGCNEKSRSTDDLPSQDPTRPIRGYQREVGA